MANSILAKMAVLISANTAAFDKNIRQSENVFNRFSNLLSGAGRLIGAAFGSVAVYQGLKAGIGIMADFEATMSEVRAITGATGKEFESLEKDAMRLGASTKFTATQVGQLQVAYGRLGFTTKEILNATEATLDLAAATGEDLAKSADVAGSTVRGFGLNARETQRVVDVMAASFNKTALGLENFTESMKYVAPVANAAGATVEETTAFLGTLADAGIRGSMAGTALRKIFTDMTKDGRPLRDRLAELAKKGITLQDSFDEVGRTAQTALLVLSKNTDKSDELTKSFQNVSGEAAKMARIMQDNLTGDVTKLTSAWEGLIIKMSDTSWMRSVTKDLTGILNALSGTDNIEEELDFLASAIRDGYGEIENGLTGFIERLSEIRKESGKPIDVKQVEELAEKYKLTDAQANKLFQSILEINKALSFQEKTLKQFNEFVERNGYTDLNKAAEDYKRKLYELILAEQIQREGYRKSAMVSEDAAKAFAPTIKAADDQIAAYRRAINIINEYANSFEKAEEVIVPAIEKQVISLEYLKKTVKDLNDQYEKAALTDSARRQAIALEIDLLNKKIAAEERLKKFLSEQFTIKPKKGGSFLDAVGLNTEDIDKKLKQAGQSIKGLGQTYTEVGEKMVNVGAIIANSIVGIAEAFGDLAAGGNIDDFGQNILKAVANFAKQLGALFIATGVAEAAFQSGNPYAMIIAGAALVALGSAISGMMDKQKKGVSGLSSSASSSSGSRSERILTKDGDRIQFDAKFKIEGNDLVAVVQNTNNQNGRLRG
jgi:hypothetical protein